MNINNETQNKIEKQIISYQSTPDFEILNSIYFSIRDYVGIIVKKTLRDSSFFVSPYELDNLIFDCILYCVKKYNTNFTVAAHFHNYTQFYTRNFIKKKRESISYLSLDDPQTFIADAGVEHCEFDDAKDRLIFYVINEFGSPTAQWSLNRLIKEKFVVDGIKIVGVDHYNCDTMKNVREHWGYRIGKSIFNETLRDVKKKIKKFQ